MKLFQGLAKTSVQSKPIFLDTPYIIKFWNIQIDNQLNVISSRLKIKYRDARFSQFKRYIFREKYKLPLTEIEAVKGVTTQYP